MEKILEKMNTNNTILINGKKEIITGEVDFELYDDILGFDWESHYDIGIGVNYTNTPISIKTLKEIINDLEENGSNYISISYNCDHPDYSFIGLDISRANENDIKNYKEQKLNENKNKAEFLRKQAESLMKQANELENNG